MDTRQLIILTGSLFALCIVTGGLLSNIKKARNVLFFNLHKILSLLSICAAGWTIYQLTGGMW